MKLLAMYLAASAQGSPAENAYLRSWVDSYAAIGHWILSPEGKYFGPALKDIDQEYVQEKWEFCNKDGDDIITRVEEHACEEELAAKWGWGEEARAMSRMIAKEPIFRKLARLNPSGDLSRAQYTGAVGFQIFAQVHHEWFKYDKNHDMFWDENEVADMVEGWKDDLEEMIESFPSLGHFFEEHQEEFNSLWTETDIDDPNTKNIEEATRYVMAVAKMSWEHFIDDHDH